MLKRSTILSFVVGLSLAVVAVGADAKLEREGGAKVTFHATGPAGMSIEGNTHGLVLRDDGTSVTLDVPLAPLTTGLGVRDQHMRDKYLEVDKYPNAQLSVARTALHIPADGATTGGDAPGKLTLHGQTHDVTFHYSATGGGGAASVNGSLHIVMTDYGISQPSYMGVKVKPDVDIDASFTAKDK